MERNLPRAWPPSNYVDPVHRGPSLVIVSSVLGALSLVTVILRIYVRGYLQQRLGVDDWLIVIAMVPAIAMVVLLCIASEVWYFDRHLWDVPPSAYVTERKLVWSIEFLYIWATGIIKISILLFYRRLTKPTNLSFFLWVVWAAIISVVFFLVIFTVTLATECSPVQAVWMRVDDTWATQHDWSCTDEAAGTLACTIASTVQDFVAALLPLYLFWRIEFPLRQKIGLGFVFTFGFILVGVGVIRVYLVHYIFYQTDDLTWYAHALFIWTAVETLAAIICASLPALRVLLGDVFRDRSLDYTYSTGSYDEGVMRLHGSARTSMRESDEEQRSIHNWPLPSGKPDPEQGGKTHPRGEDDRVVDSPTLGLDEESIGGEVGHFCYPIFQSIELARAKEQAAAAMGRKAYAVECPVAYKGDTSKAGWILGF